MKMVSQLTRQAMNRHRILGVQTAAPPAACPASETVRTLYAPSAAAPESVPSAAPAPQRPRTIYQQLMSSHDRMRERHLRRT